MPQKASTRPKSANPPNMVVQVRPAKPKRGSAVQRLSAPPVSIGVRRATKAPQTVQLARGSIRVRHRELINASIAGSTSFTVQSAVLLNPGLAASFPWLSSIASNYEQYAVRRLIFEWVPIASTSTQGEIILSPEYDATDVQPTTEVQACDNIGTVSDSCWSPFKCILDPKSMMGLGPRRFVRSTNRAGDLRNYDVGKFYVCSNNQTGTSAVGKLWVDYEFEFYVPQNSPSGANAPAYSSLYSHAADQTLATGAVTTLLWDAATFDSVGFGAPVSGVFTPAAGCYAISFNASYNDTSSETFTAATALQKNGASITAASSYAEGAGVAGQKILNHVEYLISFNGTDTFNVVTLLVGAAGTLTFMGGYNSLVARLA